MDMNIVPNKKFEHRHRVRPLLHSGKARLREDRLISDAFGRHDQSMFDAAHNVFGQKVREGEDIS